MRPLKLSLASLALVFAFTAPAFAWKATPAKTTSAKSKSASAKTKKPTAKTKKPTAKTKKAAAKPDDTSTESDAGSTSSDDSSTNSDASSTSSYDAHKESSLTDPFASDSASVKTDDTETDDTETDDTKTDDTKTDDAKTDDAKTDNSDTVGKFVVGARLGFSLATGEVERNNAMPNMISGHIPFIIDLGYMVEPHIMMGVYAQYGLGVPTADPCKVSGAKCSASVIRMGVQAQYHSSPAGKIDPWFGLGMGYEWASLTIDNGGNETKLKVKGMEYFSLQAGLDFKLSRAFRVGPFINFTFGQYGSYTSESPNGDSEGDVSNKSLHQWNTVGVHGVFNL